MKIKLCYNYIDNYLKSFKNCLICMLLYINNNIIIIANMIVMMMMILMVMMISNLPLPIKKTDIDHLDNQ